MGFFFIELRKLHPFPVVMAPGKVNMLLTTVTRDTSVSKARQFGRNALAVGSYLGLGC